MSAVSHVSRVVWFSPVLHGFFSGGFFFVLSSKFLNSSLIFRGPCDGDSPSTSEWENCVDDILSLLLYILPLIISLHVIILLYYYILLLFIILHADHIFVLVSCVACCFITWQSLKKTTSLHIIRPCRRLWVAWVA